MHERAEHVAARRRNGRARIPMEGLAWSGIWYASHLAKMLLPVLLPVATVRFSLRTDQAAIPLTGFLLLAIASKLISGWLADRLPCKPLVVGATLGSAVSLVLASQAATFTGLTACWCLLGLCDGVQFSAGLALMGRRAPSGTLGKVHGVRLTANALGTASAPLLVSLWDGGWSRFFLVAAAMTLAAMAGVLVGVREEPLAGSSRPRRETPVEAVSIRGRASGIVAGLIALQCLLAITGQSITSFTQQFFVTERHFNLRGSAALLTLMTAMGVVGPPLWGHLSDRLGRCPVLTTALLAHAASILGISFLAGGALLVGSFLVLGLVRTAVFPVTYALVSERFSTLQGRIFGVSAALGHGAGASGLLVVGILAERHGLAAVFPALAAIPLVGAALVLALRRGLGSNARPGDAGPALPEPAHPREPMV